MNRLKQLREEKGLNKNEMAAALGLKYTTYVGYENEERELNSEKLKYLANCLGVSIDYLVGRTDIRKPIIKNDDGQKKELFELEAKASDELLKRLMELSPEELMKVDAFVQGLLASH